MQFNKKYLFLSLVLLCKVYSNISAMKRETSQEMAKRFERERANQELKNAKPNQVVPVNLHGDFTYFLNATNHNATARHNQFMQNQRK